MVGITRWYTVVFAVQVALNSLAGYAFARVLAHRFGASAEKDAFDITYAIPFLILKVCGFALVHGVATTHFARLRATASPRQLNVVFSSMLTAMLVTSIVLTTVCGLFSWQLVRLLAPGLSAEAHAQMEQMLFLMIPLTFALGIGTFVSGILIAYDVPLSSEFPQIASRFGTLAWLLWGCGTADLRTIAASLTGGAVLAVLWQGWILVRHTPVRYRFWIDVDDLEFRAILRQTPSLLASAILAQAAYFCMQRLATCEGPGTAALITYGLGIVSPLSLLVGKPLCLTFGPRCASLIAEGRHSEAIRQTLWLTGLVLAVTIPATLLLASHAELLVTLLYGGGAFDAAAVARTARIFGVAVWAIPAAVVYWITLIPILSIRRSELSGLLLSGGHVAQIGLSYALFPRFQSTGLVWAYVIAISAQAAAGLCIVRLLHVPAASRSSTVPGMSPAH